MLILGGDLRARREKELRSQQPYPIGTILGCRDCFTCVPDIGQHFYTCAIKRDGRLGPGSSCPVLALQLNLFTPFQFRNGLRIRIDPYFAG